MKISNETKIGVLTAFSITILIIGYNFLKGNDVFSSSDDYYAFYSKIEGLEKSNAVLLNGYQIGKVSDLDLQKDGRIKVKLSINENIEFPANTLATISSSSLIGGKVMTITLGNSTQFLNEGDTMISKLEPSLTEIINPLIDQSTKVMVTLDSITMAVNNILSPKFRTNLDNSMASLSKTASNFEATSASLNQLMASESARLKTMIANVTSITTNLEKNNEKITTILANVENITDQVAKANLVGTLENANKTLSEFSAITNKINNGEGSMGLLVNDKKLYNNLNASAANLDQLFIDMKRSPGRYLSFSVFGRKDKIKTPPATPPN